MGENLRKWGIQVPSQCPLCLNNEQNMEHFLDGCPYTGSLWDMGAMIFWRSDLIQGHPDQSLREWNVRPLKIQFWECYG